MNENSDKAQQIEQAIGAEGFAQMRRQIEMHVARNAAGITTADAWIEHYLLIDFGFTAGKPYEPNSVQFYGPNGFLCWKLVDVTSIQTLAPILACK